MTHVSPVPSIDVEAYLSNRFTNDERNGSDPLRIRIRVYGVVQGVGFRPFVSRAAKRLTLAGFVRNDTNGVEIEAQGPFDRLVHMLTTLRNDAPPMAEIRRMDVEKVAACDETEFCVVPSARAEAGTAWISPDVATCAACLQEMNDPKDRRNAYPFINCTDCGPRFTIIEQVPYDRIHTTMKDFAMCPVCEAEYTDIGDRRYHAEPVACGACGPRVALVAPSGDLVATGDGALDEAHGYLREGRILAVKGLGGFHLACDATSAAAVSRLRRWKGRPYKALAVMCRDIDVARAYCYISEPEIRMLSGRERPILLLERRSAAAAGRADLSEAVAPCSGDLGVMLPYAPLHHLLFKDDVPACLVMTSGNRGDEPMVTENGDAVRVLGDIADGLLVHDRAIWARCDDSVGYMEGERLRLMRRSRGFVPLPVSVGRDLEPTLALGAMLNHTFALARGRDVFLSQHIGDVDTLETLAFLRDSMAKFQRWLGADPVIVAHDLHPNLLTTRLAHDLGKDRRRIGVQHHHAHFAAAMAATGTEGNVQGWVLDGTGWGTDGTVWGGELLIGSVERVHRAGHLRRLPLPGGDAAIRRPLRVAAAYLHAMIPGTATFRLELFQRAVPGEIDAVRRMIDRSFNTIMTSSAGRLFDAAAALLGVRDDNTYEGQAAIELEHAARDATSSLYSWEQLPARKENGKYILDPEPLFAAIVEDVLGGRRTADVALGFHTALSQALARISGLIHEEGGSQTVLLCGGVFQNRLLTRLLIRELRSLGLDPVIPDRIPVNDGGIALGQVMVANAIVAKEVR